MSERCDIAIIGGGAAGMTAGIFAAEAARAAGQSLHIVMLDGAKAIGAKILVSGGGRCNVTHEQVRPEDYQGSRTIVRNILAAFDAKAVVRWMESMGVPLKREETGKLFPVSDSARTVLASLLNRLAELDVQVRTGCRVSDVKSSSGDPAEDQQRFLIVHSQGEHTARCVILCTGGRSLPRTGSDGAGWGIARRLGHSVTETFPALVPLILEDRMFHADVSGLSHAAELSTFVESKLADRRIGSLLWTHFGISGPVVMDVSRFWVMAHAKRRPVELRCNFIPGQSFEQAEQWLMQTAQARPRLSIGKAVSDRLPERLANAIITRAEVDTAQPLGQLSREDRRRLLHMLTAMPLPVARDRGWNYAEVTAGGVPLEEIDFRTLASRRCPGLFLAGEVLDCDGRIGGFNFQWAWATGFLAGRGALREVIG